MLVAAYLFWIRQPLPGLIVVGVAVLQMEKLLHTEYVIADRQLFLLNGRFAAQTVLEVDKIKKIEICRPTWMGLKRGDCVLLTTENNKSYLLTPENPEEFCRILLKRQQTTKEEEA
jgi:hypothetical protein